MTKRKVHHKTRRSRTRASNSFKETNQLIGGATKAVIGLGVLGATTSIASELLKK